MIIISLIYKLESLGKVFVFARQAKGLREGRWGLGVVVGTALQTRSRFEFEDDFTRSEEKTSAR